MKICNVCKVDKPLEEFSKLHCTKDGRAYACLTCSRVKAKAYRDLNREQYNVNQKLGRQTEKTFIAQLLHGAKTRSKQKGFEFSLTVEFITDLLHKIDYKCQITGQQMNLNSFSKKDKNPFKVSLDRVDSTKGYTEDNVQLTCWAVNLMKNTFDEEDFKFWIDTIHKAISSQA